MVLIENVDTFDIPFINVSFQFYVCATPTSILQFWACRRPRKGLWFAMSIGDNSYKQGKRGGDIQHARHARGAFWWFLSLFVSRLTNGFVMIVWFQCVLCVRCHLYVCLWLPPKESSWQIASQGNQLSASLCKYRAHK